MSSWNMAWRSLRRRKLRTSLTVSGIVVGVSMIMIILSIAAGFNLQSRTLIRALSGADMTVVNGTITTGGPEGRFGFLAASTINQSTAQNISQISGVYAVTPQLASFGQVNGNRANLIGVDPSTYASVPGGLNVVSGSFLTAGSDSQIVLGKALADALGVGVGNNVTVTTPSSSGGTLQVVGVFETGTGFQENVGCLSLSYLQNATGRQGLVSQILVKATDSTQVNAVSSRIASTIPGVRVITAASLLAAQGLHTSLHNTRWTTREGTFKR